MFPATCCIGLSLHQHSLGIPGVWIQSVAWENMFFPLKNHLQINCMAIYHQYTTNIASYITIWFLDCYINGSLYIYIYIYIYIYGFMSIPPKSEINPQFHPDQTNLAPHLAIAAGADACVEADETTTP
jgi:hypothetical protein